MSERPARPGSIRRYIFFNEHRPSRAWMPALDRINERFVQHLRTAFVQTLPPEIEVTPAVAIQLVKHSELVNKIAAPCHLTLAGLGPLRGTILVALAAPLISWIVECRFGGNGRFPIAAGDRKLSPFEHKTAARFTKTVIEQFVAAWRPIAALEPHSVRQESDLQLVSICHPAEQVIVSSFEVRIGQGGGKLTICIPYQMLEPLHDRLVGEAADGAVDVDPSWQEALKTGVGRAKVLLTAELMQLQVTLGELSDLRVGSSFAIDLPHTVSVNANGVPLFRGSWGKHGRKIAVRVEERLRAADAMVTTGVA
jgi:flagellar motor switch protein FliM